MASHRSVCVSRIAFLWEMKRDMEKIFEDGGLDHCDGWRRLDELHMHYEIQKHTNVDEAKKSLYEELLRLFGKTKMADIVKYAESKKYVHL